MRYRSNLQAPELAGAFNVVCRPRPDTMGHDGLSDPDFDPNCGFLTHDEAAILYAIARAVPGPWIDIGSRTGWTTAHIAAAGNPVCAVDPELTQDRFYDRWESNLRAAGVLRLASAWATTSAEFFLVAWNGRASGVMIDGNHDAPFPLEDARAALDVLADPGVIVFHDVLGRPIQDAVEFLIRAGLSCRVYSTPRMMAACWRGDLAMPAHVPDPAIDWAEIRKRLEGFPWEACR